VAEPITTGPIEVRIAHPGRSVVVEVGSTQITVQATPKGRRVYVTIDDGKADVQTARRTRDGRWI
jgi:hypothetical protein